MSEKFHEVVVFTKNNARILKVKASELYKYETAPNALIDPSKEEVRGLAPHYWKLSGGKIKPLSVKEIVYRQAHILRNGVDNDAHGSLVFVPKRSIFKKILLWIKSIFR